MILDLTACAPRVLCETCALCLVTCHACRAMRDETMESKSFQLHLINNNGQHASASTTGPQLVNLLHSSAHTQGQNQQLLPWLATRLRAA